MKHITVTVPDEVYTAARIRAAERDTSVSALVADFLRSLGDDSEFSRLHARQRELQRQIGQFSARDRLSRDQVHERALP